MARISDDIKESFRSGNALTRLILVNLGVYIVYLLLKIIGNLMQVDIAGVFTDIFALPSNLGKLALRPWTLVTYMFYHQSFWHIFFNLLWLYFGGQLFMEYFGGRRLLSTFLIGGLIGGGLYVLFYNIFPAFQEAVMISNNRGASAGIMAIIVGIATYHPRYPVQLFFVLTVPLWGIAAGFVLLDLIGLGDGAGNPGGRIAHLGGAAFGFFMARAAKEGKDITAGFSQFVENIQNWFTPKPKIRKVYSKSKAGGKVGKNGKANVRRDTRRSKADDQARLDEILDKISRSGYDSLSKEEKDHLFKIGRD